MFIRRLPSLEVGGDSHPVPEPSPVLSGGNQCEWKDVRGEYVVGV